MKAKTTIVLGTGGVGKTTLSSAIALDLAHKGNRVLVMTLDPARRLANSMGLTALSDEPTMVFSAGQSGGILWALMPDTQRVFDRLVAQYAPSPKTYKRIMNNKFYETISTSLSGSHEYLAVEKLYNLIQSEQFDHIVLDTPPSSNVMAFLNAPQRMIDFCDDRYFKFFLLPYQMMGRSGQSLFKKGSDFAIRLLQKLTGVELLLDLSEFFFNFKDMYQGIRQRASAIHALLHDAQTNFVFVCGPSRDQLETSLRFIKSLKNEGIVPRHVIVNKVHKEVEEFASGPDAQRPEAIYQYYLGLYQLHRQNIARFARDLPPTCLSIEVPSLLDEVNSLEGLAALGPFINSVAG